MDVKKPNVIQQKAGSGSNLSAEVNKWRNKRYEEQRAIRPFCQWNAGKANKAMMIQEEYALMVGWQGEQSSSWELVDCVFEGNSQKEPEVKKVWQTNEPVMVFLGIADKFHVYAQPVGPYKKGARKPDEEPFDPALHRTRTTYLVAFLEYNSENDSYDLLHTKKPLRFTPHNTNSGEFYRLYQEVRKLIIARVKQTDVPSFLIPVHLGVTQTNRYNAERTVCKRINTPVLLSPTKPEEIDDFYTAMGDHLRLQMQEWYDEYIAIPDIDPEHDTEIFPEDDTF